MLACASADICYSWIDGQAYASIFIKGANRMQKNILMLSF